MKPLTVIGFLGSTLDASKFGPSRWNKWRPSVALAMHEDLRVDRFVLLHGATHTALADYVARDIADVSPETTVDRRVLGFNDPWDFEEVYGKLLDFALAYPFDPEAEDYLIHITTGTHVVQICLFLLTEANYLPGKLLQTSPAKLVDGGAPGRWTTIDLDLSRYDSIATRFAAASAESTSFLKSGIDTRNAAFNHLIDEIEQVAVRSKAPVLLMGPTGAGKSQLARRIYELKRLKHQVKGPFVEVNCATLKGDSAMSALFGHKRGAFTGAHQDHIGLFQRANGGTLLLDEIGDTSPAFQVKLLRVLQEGELRPVGASSTVRVDVRVIAATHRDLEQDVATGRFRSDLYYRLSTVSLGLPPLRERTADLMPIAKKLLDDARLELDLPNLHFADDALASLIGYPWPGNIRELRNEIYRAAALSEGSQIGAHSFSWRVMQGQGRNTNDIRLSPPTGTLQEQLDAIEATILKESLLRHRWNKTHAARELGLSRVGLRQKLRRLGLEEAR